MKNKLFDFLDFYNNSYTGINLNNGLNFIRHLDGELIFASKGLCFELGYESFEAIDCKKFNDLLGTYSNYNKEIITNNNDKLIEGADIVDVVVKFKKNENLVLFSLMPIKLDEGTIIGVHGLGRYITYPSHREIVSKLCNSVTPKFLDNIELNSREQVIVALLIAGYTQEEIGQHLGYSRGHIAKLIATEICPKFGLCGSSTKRLIKLAVDHDVLHGKIPEDITNNIEAFSLSI